MENLNNMLIVVSKVEVDAQCVEREYLIKKNLLEKLKIILERSLIMIKFSLKIFQKR